MSTPSKRKMTVYTAYRDGREEGINLDRESLVREHKIRAGSARARVEVSEEDVGVIEGRLYRWWGQPGDAGGVKLHWVCPSCGREQWGDWNPGVPNPCLWYSDCRCIGKWLIDWHGNP